MSKSLVAFFSAESGKTNRIAETLSRQTSSELFEIKPKKPYSEADLRYTNPMARCNREKIGKKDVPVAGQIQNWNDYDTVYLGFPIWYYAAPNVINTFCRGYDWSGKKVYIFATSGSSGIGKTQEKLEHYMNGAEIKEAKRVDGIEELADWVK